MENFYTAYKKTIDGVTFNFVKHFQTFPDLKNVPPLLKSYGMHTDFHKACRIAMISDEKVLQQLAEAVMETTPEANLINPDKTQNYNYNYRRQVNLQALSNLPIVKRLLHFKEKIAYKLF